MLGHLGLHKWTFFRAYRMGEKISENGELKLVGEYKKE